MRSLESVCVFAGSRTGADPVFAEAAAELGRIVARRGIRLVYGGGRIGLMGVLARSAIAAGGRVIGVVPDFLVRLEVGEHSVSELIVVDSMHERKRRMFEMADAFVVLPGGLGTLDETFEIVTWKQLRLHAKPIVVLDAGGYWAPLEGLIRATIAGGFAHPAVADLFGVVATPAAVLDALAAAPEPAPEVLTSHL